MVGHSYVYLVHVDLHIVYQPIYYVPEIPALLPSIYLNFLCNSRYILTYLLLLKQSFALIFGLALLLLVVLFLVQSLNAYVQHLY